MKTALVAGSTGLVGQALLTQLLENDRYSVVKALARSPMTLTHPRLQIISADFSDLAQRASALAADDVFCCLGTTMAKAGSKEKFRQVDYDYVLELARLTQAQGASQFLLVSALGANKHSRIFYNQIKGEAEESVMEIPFRTIHIFRPSLLLGERKESRAGEDAAKVLYKIFGFLIPKKYKAIQALTVARAMLTFASLDEKGIFFHESEEMQKLK